VLAFFYRRTGRPAPPGDTYRKKAEKLLMQPVA